MIKPLRSKHRQIWMVWAVLLPVGIVFAWMAIPKQVPVKLLKEETETLLTNVIRTTDKNDYTINLRATDDKTKWQLEWKNKTVLTVPSAVIYKASLNPRPTGSSGRASDGGTLDTFNPEESLLVGRIEAKGDYLFPLRLDSTDTNTMKFILYDFIHEKIIDSINLFP